MRRLLPILTPLLLSLCASAQSAITVYHGQPGQYFGYSVCEAGDVDLDGYMDVLVGVPHDSTHATNAGGLRIYSGYFLAKGLGTALLKSYSWNVAGDLYGTSVAYLGSTVSNGKNVHHYAVGMPGDDTNGPDTGSVLFVRNSSLAPDFTNRDWGMSTGAELGWSLATLQGYESGSKWGLADVVVGAPYSDVNGSNSGEVHVVRFDEWTPDRLDRRPGPGAGALFGWAVSSDGKAAIASAPRRAGAGGATNAGAIYRWVSGGTLQLIASGLAGEELGNSLSRTVDLRGDGKPELLAGASKNSANGTWSGRAVLLEKTASGPWTPLASWSGASGNDRFGFAVGIPGDLNADGFADLVVGAIGVDVGVPPFSFNTGAVNLYSGETLQQMGRYIGPIDSAIGGSIGEFADLDQDGRAEFVVGSPFSDVNGNDSGTVISLSPYPMPPSTYCTGKVNSAGCSPAMSWIGTASASDPAAFTVRATKVLNNKPGLMIYGTKPASVPFQGGTLCVGSPVKRSPPVLSGGSSGTTDCSGTLSLDFNAIVQAGTNPGLVPGQEVFAQFWYRDPAATGGSGLSNGLRFVVNP